MEGKQYIFLYINLKSVACTCALSSQKCVEVPFATSLYGHVSTNIPFFFAEQVMLPRSLMQPPQSFTVEMV